MSQINSQNDCNKSTEIVKKVQLIYQKKFSNIQDITWSKS